jgi:two-component system chemotaxis sensor kinase CheA
MTEQDQEIVREFLVESHENLSKLDQDLVELEKHPKDKALLASIFRTIHTIKGTCGFLSFTKLEKLTHQAENLLSQLRDGQRELNPGLVSLILETVDSTRAVLASIERGDGESDFDFTELTERLRKAAAAPHETGETSREGGEPAGVAVAEPNGSLAEDRPASAIATVERMIEEMAEAIPDAAVPGVAVPAERVEDEAARGSSVADANIRVGVGLLDKLMDLVGELVLTRNQILQFNAEREDASLNASSQRLNLITTELQEGVMKTRMQPIGMVWNKLPRVVRDIAVALGKQIRLEMDGTETELDRTIIEAIKDPLVHLVRNACDHGLETAAARVKAGKSPEGRLSLRAYHEGGQVNIEISDDGAGIAVARVKQKAIEKGLIRPEQAAAMTDREALNLIFAPGFSTAATVTNVSGRGVGMDVVKSHIEKIGGVVDLSSRVGEGTTVKLKIPLTLAIIPGLLVTSGGELFVIPQVSLLELIRLESDSKDKLIEHVHGTPVYRRRGTLLPIAYLNQVLGLVPAAAGEAVNLVVLQAEDRQFGLVVDGISDTQEIVVKPLGKQLKGLTEYAGATIMGDGRVALILDVLGVGRSSGVLAESRDAARAAVEAVAQAADDAQRLLLFRAGSFERLAVPLSLVARLEEIPRGSIERAGGLQVVQYRDRILPLVSMQSILEPQAPAPLEGPELAQVIVFHDGNWSAGVVVDQILDVVEEMVTIRRKTRRKGLIGSGVVGKKVADFIDLNEVIRAVEDGSPQVVESAAGRCVLLAEHSAFTRGLIRSSLDMAGYRVMEAADLSEAIQWLEQRPVDAIMATLNLEPSGIDGLLEEMRRRPEWAAIPVVALAESAEQATARSRGQDGVVDCRVKHDRDGMMESLARLDSVLSAPEASMVAIGEEQ